MHVGFTSMNTLDDIAPAELGRLLEDAGYESLWTGEHPQIPVERRTPYPAGGELPAPYLEMMNPFLSLLVAAGAEKAEIVRRCWAGPISPFMPASILHTHGDTLCYTDHAAAGLLPATTDG